MSELGSEANPILVVETVLRIVAQYNGGVASEAVRSEVKESQ